MSKYLTNEGLQRFAAGLPSKLGGGATTITSGSFDNIITPGIYTMKGVSTKAPTSGSYHSLLVMKSDTGNYVQQIAIKESTTDMYLRYLSGSSWSTWVKLMKSGESVSSAATATTATSATKLETPRNINNHPFDGTEDITITSDDVDAFQKNIASIPKDYKDKVMTMFGIDPTSWRHMIGVGRAADSQTGISPIRKIQTVLFASAGDTNLMLAAHHTDPEVYVGGGAGDSLAWQKQLALKDDIPDMSNVSKQLIYPQNSSGAVHYVGFLSMAYADAVQTSACGWQGIISGLGDYAATAIGAYLVTISTRGASNMFTITELETGVKLPADLFGYWDDGSKYIFGFKTASYNYPVHIHQLSGTTYFKGWTLQIHYNSTTQPSGWTPVSYYRVSKELVSVS